MTREQVKGAAILIAAGILLTLYRLWRALAS
jgi:hypothetical protein